MWEFRFFYANLHDILLRDPQLHRQYLELQQEFGDSLQALLRELNIQRVLQVPDDDIIALAQNLKMLLSCWISYQQVQSLETRIGQAVLYNGMVRVLTLLKPYFHGDKGLELNNILAHYRVLAGASGDPFHK